MQNQIARAFDPVTLGKIKRSAIVALVGFAVAVLPMVQEDVLKTFADKPYLVAFITAFGGWAYNALRQWLAGQPQE